MTAGVRYRGVAVLLLLLPIALSLLIACGEPQLGPGVALRIDGRDVAYGDFEEFLSNLVGDESSLQTSAIASLFETFVEEELLYALALDRDLVSLSDPRNAAVPALLSELGVPVVSEEQRRAYYDENRSRFEEPERVRLEQILVKEEELAQRAHRELESGESWALVASRLEQEHGAVVGPQGVLARADLPERFAEAVFGLEEGAYSEVLKAEYGFHVFRVAERLSAGVQPFEVVRPQIERTLVTAATDALLEDLVSQARDRYNVVIAEENLPFQRVPAP